MQSLPRIATNSSENIKNPTKNSTKSRVIPPKCKNALTKEMKQFNLTKFPFMESRLFYFKFLGIAAKYCADVTFNPTNQIGSFVTEI